MSIFDQKFAQTLTSLNPEQLAAVKNTEGVVLVVAGPGTGKTHILSARIGQILTKTDTAPYNILCLTFTDAGVQAMRDRLLQLIGPAAHKVHIFTFHAFCNKIIQDNLDLFGRQDLAPLDDIERQELIRQLIDTLAHDHPLKIGRGSDIYFYEKHLIDLFRIMKTEAWSSDFVTQKVQEYTDSLAQRPEFRYQITKKGAFTKGDLKQEALDEEVKKMNRLKSAAELYPNFEQILRGAHRYDFDDMILWVMEAFERFPFFLRQFQEQYLYVLVDEYQDTNGAQNKILSQLIAFWENPNVFIVGDDDQAIYEFQGARLKSLVDFYKKYERTLLTVVLQENYRSTQMILDASKHLIDLNNLRIINQLEGFKVEKKLVAKGVNAVLEHDGDLDISLPKICEYPNRLHELVDVVQKIEALLSGKTPPPSIALIYARHREAQNFISLFEKRGIPYQTKRRINILTTPFIQNLRLFLNYLLLESELPYSGEHLLFKLLNINFLGINADDVLALTKYIFQKNNSSEILSDAPLSISGSKKGFSVGATWRDTIFDLPELNFVAKENLVKKAVFLKKAIQSVQNESVVGLLSLIFNESGLMTWTLAQPNRLTLTQALTTFFDFAKIESEKKPQLSLDQFLRTLDLMDKNRISIDLAQNIVVNTEGVVLTTAHGAKGLEFDHVFIVDAVETEWESAKSGSSNRFKLPDTLTFTTEENALEARRRLFYVAATRARTHLNISYARADEQGKTLTKSQFVSEILDSETSLVAFEKIEVSVKDLFDSQIMSLAHNDKIDAQLIEKQFITEVLKEFKLTVSALHLYLECPLSFYFEYILKIPSLMSEAARFGNAMHYALRKLFGEMLRDRHKMFPAAEDFVRFFEWDMQRQRGYFSENAFTRRLTLGREYLTKFYFKNIETWSKEVLIEKSVVAEIEGVPVKGVLDKVEFSLDGSAHIVDYKTGKPTDDRTRRATARNQNGGAFWRQLVFYKLLYENYRAGLVPVKAGTIAYLEPDEKGNFKEKTFDFEDKDAQILRGLVRESWAKIQNHEFSGCGKPTCAWCNFTQNNAPLDALRQSDLEAFDD